MDDPKSSVGLPTSLTGAPPPNLPVANNPSLPSKTTPPPPPMGMGPKIAPPVPKPIESGIKPLPSPQGDIVFPRSSIRTMESDIKSAQTGKAPQAIEIKPPVLQAAPKPEILAPTKPSLPTSSSGVKLGDVERRTTPLPGQSMPKPVIFPPALPVKPPTIAVPPEPSSFGSKKLMAGLVIIVLLAVGGFLWWRSRPIPGLVVFTPTPSVSETPSALTSAGSPVASTLTFVFPQFFHLAVSPNDQQALANFNFEATGLVNKSAVDKNTLVFVKEGLGDFYKFSNFLNRFTIGFPVNLVSSIKDDDFGIILTKQAEFFDPKGHIIASPSAEMLLTPKVALAVRVVDAVEAKNQLISWEPTMIADLRDFYDFSGFVENNIPFQDNIYHGVKIRYINFPNADRSLDYGIITAKNGNDYLVIANSREQMFSIIDKLLGF